MVKVADPGFTQRLMERSKGVVTVGAAVAVILGHGVVEESVGKEFLYPAVTTVIADVTGLAPADAREVEPDEDPPELPGVGDEVSMALEREIARERLREATARADLAELELRAAEVRLEAEAGDEHRMPGADGGRPRPTGR